jgi:hypothetical protein
MGHGMESGSRGDALIDITVVRAEFWNAKNDTLRRAIERREAPSPVDQMGGRKLWRRSQWNEWCQGKRSGWTDTPEHVREALRSRTVAALRARGLDQSPSMSDLLRAILAQVNAINAGVQAEAQRQERVLQERFDVVAP